VFKSPGSKHGKMALLVPEKTPFSAIVFGTPIVLCSRGRPSQSVMTPVQFAEPLKGARLSCRRQYREAANTAGSMREPRAQSVAGFNFAMWSVSSSSVARPVKYMLTIS
jgi:hypothetical protein